MTKPRPGFLAVTAAALLAAPIGWALAADAAGHDAISRLSGSLNRDDSTFLPLFTVVNGCHPYAAVQDDGSYTGGLSATGSETGSCQGNGTGQAIVRSRCEASGLCAHMYALYFPKDQGMAGGVPVPDLGHRHEWENLVVWSKDGAVVAASFSQHSGYEILRVDDLVMNGNTVSVHYQTGGSPTHSFYPGDGGGSPMPAAVSVDTVSAAARTTLNDPRTWGGIDFPERDDNFATKLAKARPSWL